jgi:hypothetical protein
MVLFIQSYKFGIEQEKKVLPFIKEYFNNDIKQSLSPTAKSDFFDDTSYYELKSRKNSMKRYKDTMITADKIIDNKPLILLFNFTDCLCFIKYNKELFSTFRTEIFSRDNIEEGFKQHYFIPVDKLTIIKTY